MWLRLDCRVGAEARRGCPVGGGGTGRPAAAQRQPHALASGSTTPLLSLLNGEQKWAVEGQRLQKNGIRRPGPERSPPGRRDASNEKDKKGSGVQNEVRAFLAACSWAERRAGTAPAALFHPAPPPRRAARTVSTRLPAPASLSCCSLHQPAGPERLRGAPLSLHVNLNTGNHARRVEPDDGLVRAHRCKRRLRVGLGFE